MPHRAAIAWIFAIGCCFPNVAWAVEPRPTVIVANRATEVARCEIRTPLPSSIPFALEPGQIVSVPYRDGAVLMPLQAGQQPLPLAALTLYLIEDGPGGRGLVAKTAQLPPAIGWQLAVWPNRAPVAAAVGSTDAPRRDLGIIRVEIAVDDNEPTPQSVWEKRLSQRLAAASQVLEYHTDLKIEVVGARRWTTDESVNDFDRTLNDFERATSPGKDVDLVIGFSSQFELQRGRFHLGGTHGMLARHILLKEFSKSMTEIEKLEVLVHELGHYLGASHTGEESSVMRPLLGDRQARAKRFRIFYDPLNALAINIIANDFRAGVRSRGELSQAARERLLPIYALMEQTAGGDETTRNMLGGIGAQKVDVRLPFRLPQ